MNDGMDLDALDPLGMDWKARGERGTARIRERAIMRDAGEFLPADGVQAALVEMAGTVQGILAGIPDATRTSGAKPDLVERVREIVVDAQLQVSLAMDSIVDRAIAAVDAMEGDLEAQAESAFAGPSERKERTKRGRDAVATTKPRVKKA